MQLLKGIMGFGWILCVLVICIKKLKFKNINNLILFVAITFGLLAFFQKASDVSDLQEAFTHLNGIRKKGFDYFSSEHYLVQNYFGGKFGLQLYFYLCSIFPYNNFYSAISMFLMYFLLFKCLQYVVEYYKLDENYFKNLMVLLILTINFYNASNGVRNLLAFSFFVYGLVIDIYRGRRIFALILYVFIATFHPSAAALVVLRYLMLVKSKVLKIVLGIIVLFWASGLNIILDFLQRYTSSGFLSMLYTKLMYYSLLEGSNAIFEEGFNTSTSYMIMRYFRIAWVLIVLAVSVAAMKNTKDKKEISSFTLQACLFSLGTLPSIFATNVFSRYSVVIFMGTPLLLCQYASLNLPEKKLKIGRLKVSPIKVSLYFDLILILIYYLISSYSAFEFTTELYC